jgi:hypothetical protein
METPGSMKTKGRRKSTNIEDRRPGKIKSNYSGLDLSSTFSKQVYPKVKPIKKRGRSVGIGALSRKVYVKKSGGYR